MKYSLLALLLFCCCSANAQNLVPNPSFEDTIGCPDNEDQVFKSIGWHAFQITPDYFNKCSKKDSVFGVPIAGVPHNWAGVQYPSSGVAYCGLYCYDINVPSARESVGTRLSSTLQVGQKYYASVKVSLAEASTFATNNLGIGFRTVAYHDSLNWQSLVTNKAQVHTSNIILDSAKWIIISGSFIADSAYQYVMVGNFYDDASTDTVRVNEPFNGMEISYYYIDDVCVSADSSKCELSNGTNIKIINEEIEVYPTPSNDKLYIKCDFTIGYSIQK